MKTIWKYKVNTIHNAPLGLRVLHVGFDPSSELCAWCEVNPLNRSAPLEFRTIGTGQDVPSDMEYAGTARHDIYMWHIYWKHHV